MAVMQVDAVLQVLRRNATVWHDLQRRNRDHSVGQGARMQATLDEVDPWLSHRLINQSFNRSCTMVKQRVDRLDHQQDWYSTWDTSYLVPW